MCENVAKKEIQKGRGKCAKKSQKDQKERNRKAQKRKPNSQPKGKRGKGGKGQKQRGKGSGRNPCGLILWGLLSVCVVCRVYVYYIIIYRALWLSSGLYSFNSLVVVKGTKSGRKNRGAGWFFKSCGLILLCALSFYVLLI